MSDDNSQVDVAPLIPGAVDADHFECLVRWSTVRTANIISALRAHLVQGDSQHEACAAFGVDKTTLSRRVRVIQKVNADLAADSARFYAPKKR